MKLSKLREPSTFILSDSCLQNNKTIKFSENKSKSYVSLLNKTKYYMYEFNEATLSQDNIILFVDNNKHIKINNFTFVLAHTLFYNNQPYMSGVIGLKVMNKDEKLINSDFIIQLKKNKLIESYPFTLEYTDYYNGFLYIGNYFHEFNDSYNINDFISTKAGYQNSKEISWEINIDMIFINDNHKLFNNTYISLFYEIGIIAAPYYYYNYIMKNFFNDQANNMS